MRGPLPLLAERKAPIPAEPLTGGPLSAAISNTVVRRLAETTGRGPSTARTTVGSHDVTVVVHDSLTRGERVLVDHGDQQAVLDLRQRWQSAMRRDLVADIEALTGRTVVAFMSANHLDPDLAAEIFILEPTADPAA